MTDHKKLHDDGTTDAAEVAVARASFPPGLRINFEPEKLGVLGLYYDIINE